MTIDQSEPVAWPIPCDRNRAVSNIEIGTPSFWRLKRFFTVSRLLWNKLVIKLRWNWIDLARLRERVVSAVGVVLDGLGIYASVKLTDTQCGGFSTRTHGVSINKSFKFSAEVCDFFFLNLSLTQCNKINSESFWFGQLELFWNLLVRRLTIIWGWYC